MEHEEMYQEIFYPHTTKRFSVEPYIHSGVLALITCNYLAASGLTVHLTSHAWYCSTPEIQPPHFKRWVVFKTMVNSMFHFVSHLVFCPKFSCGDKHPWKCFLRTVLRSKRKEQIEGYWCRLETPPHTHKERTTDLSQYLVVLST